jgi:AcrR family transcriptional regulator
MEKALDRALRVFWQKGYEGASLTDLTKAMRINRPSLYAAFGDKEQLFHKVLDRYDAVSQPLWQAAEAEPTARGFAEKLLHSSADYQTCPNNPRGCLLVHGALAGSTESTGVCKEIDRRRNVGEVLIFKRLQRAQREGDLPAHADPMELTHYLTTVLRGMATQALVGATRKDLDAVVRVAMRAWPSR